MLRHHNVEFRFRPGLPNGPERGQQVDSVPKKPEIQHEQFARAFCLLVEGIRLGHVGNQRKAYAAKCINLWMARIVKTLPLANYG
jgi:hypothetical protein